MNFKSIRKFFGIKTYMEKYVERREAEMIRHQCHNDKLMERSINEIANKKFSDWVEDQQILASIPDNDPYKFLKIPIRIDHQVCSIYYVDHYETAKYLGNKAQLAANEKFEQLKSEWKTK